MFKAIFEFGMAKVRSIDPKLVASGVVLALTYGVTKALPEVGVSVGLEDQLIAGVTVGQSIALVAAAAAGWWKANAGTLLRSDHESGNAIDPHTL